MKGSVYVYLTVDYSFVVYPEGYQKLCADYSPMAPGIQGGRHSSHQAAIKVGALARAAVGAGLGLHTYTAM